MQNFKGLLAYEKAFELAMDIFYLTKKFPKEETYSLTDQIRRSSRSVCACIGEGYRKRNYSAHFISKMTDADMENTETQVWLQFSFGCNYISNSAYQDLLGKSEEVGRLIYHMITHPEKYIPLNEK